MRVWIEIVLLVLVTFFGVFHPLMRVWIEIQYHPLLKIGWDTVSPSYEGVD